MVGTARGAVQPQKPPGINAVLCTGPGVNCPHTQLARVSLAPEKHLLGALTNHPETGDKEPAPHVLQAASHGSQSHGPRAGGGEAGAGLGGFLLPQEGRPLPCGQEHLDCLHGGCTVGDGLAETEKRSLPGSAAEEGQSRSSRHTGATEPGPGHLPPPDPITATFDGRGPCSAPGCSDQTQQDLSTCLTPACIRKGGREGGGGGEARRARNTGEPLRTLHCSHPRDPETHSHTPESYVPQKTCVRMLPAALFSNRKQFLEAIHMSTHHRADKETGHLQTMGFQTTLKVTDLWVHTSLRRTLRNNGTQENQVTEEYTGPIPFT